MYQFICDFTEAAGIPLMDKLAEECQYQLDLTDGCYVLFQAPDFDGITLEPAKSIEAQAVLQHFAGYGCPFSCLRLGRSLARRNVDHGPIVSDELAVRYLLSGIEGVSTGLLVSDLQIMMTEFIGQAEFYMACVIADSYIHEKKRSVCPEVKSLIDSCLNRGSDNVLQ